MTSNRGAGHLGPLFPFARAFRQAGHDVLLAAPGSTRAMVEGAGVPFLALADPPQDQLDAVLDAFPGLSSDEQGVRMMQEVFAGIDCAPRCRACCAASRTTSPPPGPRA